MLCFLGDIHGRFQDLIALQEYVLRNNPNEKEITFIQVGDFGFYKFLKEDYYRHLPRKVYFIRGNHDDNQELTQYDKITEVWHNAFYIPDGYVWNIEGKRLAFLGGATSVDKKWRTPYVDWFPQEIITSEQVGRFDNVEAPDYLITHTAPQYFIDRKMDQSILEHQFGLSRDWKDTCSLVLDDLWNKWNRPEVICGHLHKSVYYDKIRVLGINEIFSLR